MNKEPTKIGNIYRRRVIEAMTFFAQKVKRPNKTLMFKMLATLDFRHFTETGLPVTALEWKAYKRGPVPEKLHLELPVSKDAKPPDDISSAVDCHLDFWEDSNGVHHPELVFTARRKPDFGVFTPRQRRILDEIVEIYKPYSATTASQASHERNTPWSRTVKKWGEHAVIDFLDTVDLPENVSPEVIRINLSERNAVIANYSRD